MKSFLKQIDENFKRLDEKDWDGDGNQESDTDEYMGVKDKAIKNSLKTEDSNLEFKTCDNCSGKLTPHVKEDCQRCAKHESAKPDYLDFDKDGDTDEPMKDALAEDGEIVEHTITFTDDDMKSFHKTGKVIKKDPDGKEHTYVYKNKDIDEMSTSAGAGSYNTPKAFAPTTNNKNATASTGMNIAPKTSLHTEYDLVQEAMDSKYEHLIEGYRTFALGKSNSTPNQTVNSSIREVAKKLKEIEETIRYTGRLKTESGISHSGFTEGTRSALNKISHRLIKISERVRALGE